MDQALKDFEPTLPGLYLLINFILFFFNFEVYLKGFSQSIV